MFDASLWGGGAVGPLGGCVVCMRDICILKKMGAIKSIYFGRHFARLKYFPCL
jgi:hypothetical protein